MVNSVFKKHFVILDENTGFCVVIKRELILSFFFTCYFHIFDSDFVFFSHLPPEADAALKKSSLGHKADFDSYRGGYK